MYKYKFNQMPLPPNLPSTPPNFNIYENRGNEKKKNKFKNLKENAFTSLNEVEKFLCDFSSVSKYVKLFKLLKK